MDALLYKIQNDPYYHDSQIDYNALNNHLKLWQLFQTCLGNI